jgi:murein DD-endopeptidase MepM/ murein hydrolase activator NlpD
VRLVLAALLVAGISLPALPLHGAETGEPSAQTAQTASESVSQQLRTAAIQGPVVIRDGFTVSVGPEPPADADAARAERLAQFAALLGYRTAPTFINYPDSAVQWPFPVGVPISDGFGPRVSPGGIGSTNHQGVDFVPGDGTPINAVAAGVVSRVQRTDQGGLGVFVVIDHVIDGQQVSSWYAHMRAGSPVVTEGQTVYVGQQIGLSGNTGTSTGPHTHLEIHLGEIPIDPIPWLQAHNVPPAVGADQW